MKKTIYLRITTLVALFVACSSFAVAQKYKIDPTFEGKNQAHVVYMALMKGDNICCLKGDANIAIINSKGKQIATFPTNMTAQVKAVAVDKSDNIYVLGALNKIVEVENRGQKVKVNKVVGATCIVLDKAGKKVREMELPGAQSVTGAKIVDNNLIIADVNSRLIVVYDATTGAKKSAFEKKISTCCGIFDFDVNAKKEIVVAHLGSFRVDTYDMKGNLLSNFGERGKEINQFIGCCNPVSVGVLSDGGLVTVEKDPTRIKIYDTNKKAYQIHGVEELVKGCSYIPVAVDKKNGIYLASKNSGVIKCVLTK